MFGAILGDIIGSVYEFDRSPKIKEFPLFSNDSSFTDDTVMTIAIGKALIDIKNKNINDELEIKEEIIKSMKYWGRKYPNAGYGAMFIRWLSQGKEAYNSFGNGSAMRVSSVGWLYDTLEETLKMARYTAEVTHNHIEGIKGAKATAAAIFLSRNGYSKEEIKDYIVKEFNYDLNRTCDEIRPNYHHVESCQETVPEAIISFLEGESFEDVIRNAISLGGDADTLTCIAGSIAEAYYGIPKELKEECLNRIDDDIKEVLIEFEKIIEKR